MKVVGIIQARMRSTRLPAKILKQVCGKTVLEHDIIRLRAARLVDEVVVATGEDAANDPVAAEARRAGAVVSRGSEGDVLDRFHQAARESGADVIVRMTSDCPLFDPQLLDRMLTEFLAALETDRPFDYYSNTLGERTYPTGLDAEIFTRAALDRAHREAVRVPEREHVTPYLHQNPQLFRLGGMRSPEDHSRHRWTLDTPEDWTLIEAVYERVYREDRLFTTEEVLDLFQREPDLFSLNRAVQAKAIDPEIRGGLVIRVDMSPTIGAGHFMRCLALAQAWPRERGPVLFVMAEGGARGAARLREEGFELEQPVVAVASADDARTLVQSVERSGAEWLVVDGYRFGPDFLRPLTGRACRLLFIDDEGAADLPPVDAVLNQNLHAAEELYRGLPGTSRLLLGLDYQLLRREFLAVKGPSRTVPDRARHLLVTLGGGDTQGAVDIILQALTRVAVADLQVRVLAGGQPQDREALAARAAELPHEIEVLGPVADMPAQYAWADLAVTAGGSTLWELAFCGLPALVTVLAENQEPSSRLLSERGAVRLLGPAADLKPRQVAVQLVSLLDDPAGRQKMVDAGCGLVDGRGAERLVQTMLHWSRRRVS